MRSSYPMLINLDASLKDLQPEHVHLDALENLCLAAIEGYHLLAVDRATLRALQSWSPLSQRAISSATFMTVVLPTVPLMEHVKTLKM